jgi:glycosyltransferase involved in cell wall biosynthesis
MRDRPSCEINHVYFTTFGVVTDIRSMGGVPYFFWRALIDRGVSLSALDLPRVSGVFSHRTLWWLGRLLTLDMPTGYRFSAASLEHAWRKVGPLPEQSEIISHFQLFPPSIIRQAQSGKISLSYYIDLTLKELFAEYPDGERTSRRRKSAAIRLETEGYQVARRITTWSTRSAEVLQRDYGIDGSKIDTVIPGANIDDQIADSAVQAPFPLHDSELIIGFVGMGYRRKGLLPLAAAVLRLRQKGVRVRLRVIGPTPPSLQNKDGIELIGRIDKSREMHRFAEILSSCHLGALPSSAEGCPISLLEFLRLGIPVIATRVNGIPDVVNGKNGILVEADFNVSELADVIESFARDPAMLERYRRGAFEYRKYASWRRVAEQYCAPSNGAIVTLTEHYGDQRRDAAWWRNEARP